MTAARLRPQLPLAVLLVAGVALRVWLMAGYRPAVLSNADSARFLHFAHYGDGLFKDHFGPSGYAAFLKVTRFVSDRIEVTIALQHLLGIAAALLLYAAVRRAGAPRWAATIPAAFGLVWGELVYFEHTLLSEPPFVILVAGGLYAAVRGIAGGAGRRGLAWLALGGALVALAALFRNVGLVLPPLLAVWALAAASGTIRDRLLAAGSTAVASGLVIGAYLIAASAAGGTAGMSDVSGWNLYGVSAPFADCSKFTPPAGTRRLCQTTPKGARPGPLFYLWFRGSPARAAFGHPPVENGLLGRFGRAALAAQPLDYLEQTLSQLPRFADPGAYHRRYTGGGRFSIARRNAAVERQVGYELHRDYRAAKLHVGGVADAVDRWELIERAGGVVPALLFLLTLVGAVLARGLARRALLLFGIAATALVALPAATLTLISRYTIPPLPLMAASAGLGAWAIAERLRARKGGR